MDLTDGFQIGRADLPVGFKRACAVPQDGLRAGDPGIVVTENPRVFLVSRRIRADLAEIQIIFCVGRLQKDDAEPDADAQ